MAKPGISVSISAKLILASTLMLGTVIAVFALTNRLQAGRLIDTSSARLKQHLIRDLDKAGRAQLGLVAEIARTTVAQNDLTTLQRVVQTLARADERLSSTAVLDASGALLAHSDPSRARGTRPRELAGLGSLGAVRVEEVARDGKRTLVFIAPVMAGGTRLCTAVLVYDLSSIEAELHREQTLRAGTDAAAGLRSTLVISALALLVGLLITIVLGFRLSRPIQEVVRQVDRIAGGDLQARVQVTSHDEIGLLAERFNHMVDQVNVLLQDSRNKATIEKELFDASAIQTTILFPPAGMVRLPGLELAGYFSPATHCGGDWWGHFALTHERTMVLVGDVTGHGVGSAMIAAAAQGAAHTVLALGERDVGLGLVLKYVNAAIHGTAHTKFVMTCFGSLYDPRSGKLWYANAGHNFAYHYQVETGKLETLVVRGNRLGDLANSDYEIREVRVKPGDTLVWYTDGIIECENLHGESYGEKRFREVVQRVVGRAPDEMLTAIMDEAASFYDNVPQKDDLTVVVAKVTKYGG